MHFLILEKCSLLERKRKNKMLRLSSYAKFPKTTQPELLIEHLKLTENIPFLVACVVQNYPQPTKDAVQAC